MGCNANLSNLKKSILRTIQSGLALCYDLGSGKIWNGLFAEHGVRQSLGFRRCMRRFRFHKSGAERIIRPAIRECDLAVVTLGRIWPESKRAAR
jgi:hypothetical protein